MGGHVNDKRKSNQRSESTDGPDYGNQNPSALDLLLDVGEMAIKILFKVVITKQWITHNAYNITHLRVLSSPAFIPVKSGINTRTVLWCYTPVHPKYPLYIGVVLLSCALPCLGMHP